MKIRAAHFFSMCLVVFSSSCDLIRMKKNGNDDVQRKAIARAGDAYLYQDELEGIVPGNTLREDSVARVTAFVDSWIRKQLLISEAMKNIDINEAEVERKVLDYRYSLISYEYQKFIIDQRMDDSVSVGEIENYYKEHLDNFVLKQNIIRGTYLKVPKNAPRTNRLKELIQSTREKDLNELKSYCLSFSEAYHLSDSLWMEFDKMVVNTPLAEIPNKIQFLQSYRFYETTDNDFLYYLKIDAYKITDNVSPLEFVREDIKNIILNKRKVEIARQLENEVYEKAFRQKDFEIFSH
jgi:hypothetical protein